MSDIRQLVIDSVEDIVTIKRSNGQEPSSANLDEIMNSIRPIVLETLRALYIAGRVSHHKTVNGVDMFAIKEK